MGWLLLGGFWAAVLMVGAAGLGTLELLGPPSASPARLLPNKAAVAGAPGANHESDPHAITLPDTPVTELHAPPDTAAASVQTLTQVTTPISALLEQSHTIPQAQLPRVAPDGRLSRIVYAAPAPAVPAGSVRVALMVSGFGLSDRESHAAIDQLPGAVSLAVSSYATGIAPLLASARQAGHELLASIPMEPNGYPANDEGPHSLRTGLTPAENAANLEWALTRTPGVVGATGVSDGMRGERFADIPASFDPVVDEITRRGLLYIDARPGRATRPGAPIHSIDVVLDDLLGRAEIDAKLSSLERTAQQQGSAIGVVGMLRPATIERVAAWTKTLPGRGLILVPVSALVNQ